MDSVHLLSRRRPWWIIPHLLGVDIALLTLCWAHAFACILEINMLRENPLILLIGSVWLFVIVSRLISSVRHIRDDERNFYTAKIAALSIICLAVGLALLWLLLFSVSTVVLHYVIPLSFFFFLSILPIFRGSARILLRALAYAFACAIPSFYFAVTLSPWAMLSCAPIWFFGVLMYLFFQEHEQWRTSDEMRSSQGGAVVSPHLVPLGQFILLGLCIYQAANAPSYEQNVSFTLILANACLAVVVRLRRYLSPLAVDALRIPVMMIAPLAAVYILW